MSAPKYTFLLVEDDEDDIILFKEHLEDSHLNAKLICVEKEEEFKRAVETKPINAIICDNNLPDFNALTAINFAKSEKPEIPFIVLSGVLTDDLASEALKAGANDVIEKGNYYRLIPAIERELNVRRLYSSKKRMENKYFKKDAILQLITEHIDEVIGLISSDGRIIYLSPGITRITGKDISEFIGKKVYDFISKADTDRIKSNLQRDLAKNLQRTYKINIQVFLKGSDPLILETRIKPIIGDSNVTKFALVIKDKTPEVEFHDKLETTEKKFLTLSEELYRIIHESSSLFYDISLDATINDWNKSCEDITGYSRKEMIGQDFLDFLIPPEDHLRLINVFKDELRAGNSVTHEVSIITKGGEKRIWLINATPRRDINDEIFGALSHGHDITELVEYRQSLERKVEDRTHLLKEALEKEKETSALTMRFISMASHEFRTPLSTISLASSFMRRYQQKATEQQMTGRLDKIDEQVDNMIYLLDDILTIGANDVAKINLNLSQVDLNQFIMSVKNNVEQQFKSHKIIVEKKCQRDTIISDKNLLNNIFINLLSNAIKYSPGENKILWKCEEANGLFIITVEDWGIGVEECEQAKVFEPFFRAKNVTDISGTGLGLAIVKRATESLNGTITFSSKKDKGTKFIVSLPINDAKNHSIS